MAFRLPSFNLLANIWGMVPAGVPGVPSGPARVANVPCNLAFGKRVHLTATGGTGTVGVLVCTVDLLLPAGTDVRGPQDSVSADMVECPAGSGRWYVVSAVDDAGKGFSNEHRVATLYALPSSWIAPYA